MPRAPVIAVVRSSAWRQWSSYRVADWAQYLVLPVIGALETPTVLPIRLLAGIGGAAALLAYAYVLNEKFDRQDLDIPWSTVLLPVMVLLALFPNLTVTQRAWSLVFGGMVTAYSVPMTEWKSIPYLCTATNAVGFTLLLGLGGGTTSASFWVLAGSLCWVQVGVQLVHELADQQADAAAGRRTTAMCLGPAWTRRGAGLCLGVGASLAYLHSAWLTVALGAYAAFGAWQLRTVTDPTMLRARLRLIGRVVGVAIVGGLIWLTAS